MMPRILVYDHLDQPLFELDPKKVYGLKMVEKVNDEHSLTITTSHELEKGQRVFYHDGEKLREFVVLGDVASHADGFQHEYYCVWSLQYDLSAAYIDDRRIGNKNNLVPASDILTVIAGQSRWQVGTVTTTTVSSAWLYYKSLWEALGVVVENWQGEVDSTIVLSSPVARYIDFKANVGSSEAKRRFDYGHDLTSIKRTVLDDLYVCRIVPRGKGEAVEGEGGEVSGYGRRITIESVNPTGEEWIQDDSVVPLVRVPNGSGGYEYPTSIVIFDSIETPQVLYDTAIAELETYTRPKMSYEASVLALSGAGMDVEGVSLGDTVHVVDTTFGEDGLRLSARVLGIERDLLEPSNDKLTIGNFQPKMSDTVKDLIDGLSAAQEQLIDTDAKADSAISDASEAAQIAVEAQTVANAINQHFWVDTDGAHVTEVTKDEWNDTTGSRYHTGANSLWNSLGMLFRKGLTNLLAIVTSNTGGNVTGVSIYDGQGNGSSNIVASFTNNGVTVGKTGGAHMVQTSDGSTWYEGATEIVGIEQISGQVAKLWFENGNYYLSHVDGDDTLYIGNYGVNDSREATVEIIANGTGGAAMLRVNDSDVMGADLDVCPGVVNIGEGVMLRLGVQEITSDLDNINASGGITAAYFNGFRGRKNLTTTDDIDTLYTTGIYYVGGNGVGGTLPSGITSYFSLIAMGGGAEDSGTYVGKQMILGGSGVVWTRSYSGSPRTWSAWTQLVSDEVAVGNPTITNATATKFQTRRQGNTVNLSVYQLKLSAALANGGSVSLGTGIIGANARPTNVVYLPLVANVAGFGSGVLMSIGTGGNVTVYNRSGASLGTGVNLMGNTSWVI